MQPDEILAAENPPPIEFSNAVRLTLGQWLLVALFGVAIGFGAPVLWKQRELIVWQDDHRMPHELGNDYWLYGRYADLAVQNADVFLIGDSVVWGEYVKRDGTLSHYLNEGGQKRFANLGLDGAHPLALSGLVHYYARALHNKNVIVQCNPLWLTSAKADLQDPKFTDVNHARLVPQYFPWIPSLDKIEQSVRLGVLVEHHVELNQWTNHLQQAYYEHMDVPSWTIDHPYDNPLDPLSRGLPKDDDKLRHLPQPWFKSGIAKQDYAWIPLNDSYQWRGFRMTLDTLQERGNRVFVVVGPFNEHLLTPASRGRYEKIKEGIADYLRGKNIPFAMPEPLPSELYGDASHPLAEGYKLLARQLEKVPGFLK